MGMTAVEKILADHAGLEEVKAGEIVHVEADWSYADDISAPLAIEVLEQHGIDRLFDPSRLFFTPCMFSPSKDFVSAAISRRMREFAKRHGITLYEGGEMGIHHALAVELGYALPGTVIAAGSSHACTAGALGAFAIGLGSTDLAALWATGRLHLQVPETIKLIMEGKPGRWASAKDLVLYAISHLGLDGAWYRVLEFSGGTVSSLNIEGRFTLANMAVEAGAKTAFMEPDQVVENYLKGRAKGPYRIVKGDPEASSLRTVELDVDGLEPLIALPSSPANVKPLSEVGEVPLDQVYIGSCTNGWLGDLRKAAEIIRGKKVAPWVRLIVIPSTPRVYKQALQEGLIETFLEARAVVSVPTCGPCLGSYMGVLAAGERCLSTSSRNFIGRMGAKGSEVYLANPAVAAASALAGRIISPDAL